MSLKFVVDTDVISETARSRPDPSVTRWLEAEGRWALTSITVFELSRGIQQMTAPRKRAHLEEWFAHLLARSDDILGLDREAALEAAHLAVRARRAGKGVAQGDLFIAACASSRGLSVATHNVAHFSGLGISIFDPFTGSWSL